MSTARGAGTWTLGLAGRAAVEAIARGAHTIPADAVTIADKAVAGRTRSSAARTAVVEGGARVALASCPVT